MNVFKKNQRIIKQGIFFITWLSYFFSAAVANGTQDINEAVVKIYTIYNRFNYSMPWQMKDQKSRNGSGCIIKGNRILTNAHVVSDNAFIQVRRTGQTKKYTAEVETVAHDCDLAILKVEDQTFFSGADTIELGELPNIRDKVYVCGFPLGGDKLSVTEGVVSRIEHTVYAKSRAFLLACQIDAAINSGNSGGPVIYENRLVGVAFQALNSMENVGYMIPVPVIKHFLKDMEDGRYDGIPNLGLLYQKLENPDIRSYYGIQEECSGILIDKIYYKSPLSESMKQGDIILSVNGYTVGNDGTIEFRKGHRTYFEYSIQCRQMGDVVDLEILRDKKVIKIKVELSERINSWRLVPSERYDVIVPTYYIKGGLVFEPLTLNYLKEWGNNWPNDAPIDLVRSYLRGEKADDQKEIIVLVTVLADELNSGYQEQRHEIIDSVNDRKITSMHDLVKAFEENQNPYHIIKQENGYQIILDKNRVDRFNARILQRYMIRSDRSSDLQE